MRVTATGRGLSDGSQIEPVISTAAPIGRWRRTGRDKMAEDRSRPGCQTADIRGTPRPIHPQSAAAGGITVQHPCICPLSCSASQI